MSTLSSVQFADKMGEVMPVLMKAFTKCMAGQLLKEKITLPQVMVLHFLEVESETKMKDLAHFMGVTLPGMTGIVERMVRDGYCLRVYDSSDRRIIRIKLTAKGDGLIKRINAHKRQMLIKIFGKISESDRQDYLRILLQIKEILLNENPI
ncbi:MAG: MarR family transcriptional regulator [Candidatus Omnitrophica bacterium]|jgi:DNA-binding MarR family transcriptional regulator|nr:MarR family transcriptional regulator [Candidatus Omnitrophota bacterium]